MVTPASSPTNDRRTALLGATIEEIALAGTRGMRVDEIARRAGVSTALIYHHFTNRAGLLLAALEHVGERAEAYTDHADGTGRDDLIAVLLDEIQDEAVVRVNSAAWSELRGSAIFDQALRSTLSALRARWADDIADLVRRGQDDGSLDRSLEPVEVGLQLPMIVEGVSASWLTGTLSTHEARAHLESIVVAILRG